MIVWVVCVGLGEEWDVCLYVVVCVCVWCVWCVCVCLVCGAWCVVCGVGGV